MVTLYDIGGDDGDPALNDDRKSSVIMFWHDQNGVQRVYVFANEAQLRERAAKPAQFK